MSCVLSTLVIFIAFIVANGGGGMPIYVRIDGDIQQIDVPAEATVDDVLAVVNTTGVTLQFEGRLLNAGDTLADSGVGAEATIEVVSIRKYDLKNKEGFRGAWKSLNESKDRQHQFRMSLVLKSNTDEMEPLVTVTMYGRMSPFEEHAPWCEKSGCSGSGCFFEKTVEVIMERPDCRVPRGSPPNITNDVGTWFDSISVYTITYTSSNLIHNGIIMTLQGLAAFDIRESAQGDRSESSEFVFVHQFIGSNEALKGYTIEDCWFELD